MKENVFENPIEVRTAVPSPHFDDRRVVQRAQRVVPLDEIRTRVRWRKFLYLGGALAIAMVLGAASALIAVHVKRSSSQVSQIQLTNNTEPETEITETETAAATVQPETATEPVVEEPFKEPEIISTVKKQTPVDQRPRVVERENVPLTPDTRGVAPSEQEQLEQIRDAVLYERWQERRARRVARRERRNRGDRDLSAVDEIFEGRRRQDRPY
ncbi:MAG TPA: hypothetical protein VJS17_09830 [Pyrinomonadaceae bacterium]|nr:hypothetical protein [Pyrinomonadaceae bacterium]